MNLSESFNFRGIEAIFERMLDKATKEQSTLAFHYLEIGIAKGATLAAVGDYLSDNVKSGWRANGIDLCNGEYFNSRDFIRRTFAHEVSIEFCGKMTHEPFIPDRAKNDIVVRLLKSPNKRAKGGSDFINFALIDGCHGAPCVMADFLSIEHMIASNGIVAFHDAGIEDQGEGIQRHCGEPINVLYALVNLQLSTVTASCRPGWKLLEMEDGDKSPGNPCDNGNGIVFFQKTHKSKNPYQEGFTG